MSALLNLPPEIILLIAESLHDPTTWPAYDAELSKPPDFYDSNDWIYIQDYDQHRTTALLHKRAANALFNLVRTCRRIYLIANNVLWKFNAKHQASSGLCWAAHIGNIALAQYALDHGADVNATPWVHFGDIGTDGTIMPKHYTQKFCRYCGDNFPRNTTHKDFEEPQTGVAGAASPLHYAARRGLDAMVEFLISRGAQHNKDGQIFWPELKPDDEYDDFNVGPYLPLYYAISAGPFSTVKLLGSHHTRHASWGTPVGSQYPLGVSELCLAIKRLAQDDFDKDIFAYIVQAVGPDLVTDDEFEIIPDLIYRSLVIPNRRTMVPWAFAILMGSRGEVDPDAPPGVSLDYGVTYLSMALSYWRTDYLVAGELLKYPGVYSYDPSGGILSSSLFDWAGINPGHGRGMSSLERTRMEEHLGFAKALIAEIGHRYGRLSNVFYSGSVARSGPEDGFIRRETSQIFLRAFAAKHVEAASLLLQADWTLVLEPCDPEGEETMLTVAVRWTVKALEELNSLKMLDELFRNPANGDEQCEKKDADLADLLDMEAKRRSMGAEPLLDILRLVLTEAAARGDGTLTSMIRHAVKVFSKPATRVAKHLIVPLCWSKREPGAWGAAEGEACIQLLLQNTPAGCIPGLPVNSEDSNLSLSDLAATALSLT